MKMVMIQIAVLAGVLSACAPTTEITSSPIALSGDLDRQARQVAEYNLINPGSVTYRNTRAYRLANGDIAYCGEQNARNRMGGFVGYTAFYVRFTPSVSGPIRQSEQREFLANVACGKMARGETLPVR